MAVAQFNTTHVNSSSLVNTLEAPKEHKTKRLSNGALSLLTLHSTIDEMLGKAPKKAVKSPNLTDEPANHESLGQLMGEVAKILSTLEQLFMNYSSNNMQNTSEIGQIDSQIATQVTNSIGNELQAFQEKVNKLYEEQKHASLFSKIAGYVLDAVTILASAFMGPEMVALAVTMMVLQQTGALNDMKQSIAHAVNKVIPGAGDIIADVVITLAVTAIAVLTGSMGTVAEEGVEAAGEGAEEATEEAGHAATNSGQSGAQGAENGAGEGAATSTGGAEGSIENGAINAEENATENVVENTEAEGQSEQVKKDEKIASKWEKLLKRLKPFQRGKNALKMGIITFIQELSSTGLVADCLDKIPASKFGGENEKKAWVEGISIAFDIIGVVASIAVMKNIDSEEVATKLPWGGSSKLLGALTTLAGVLGGASEIASGSFQIEMGETQMSMASIQDKIAKSTGKQKLYQAMQRIMTDHIGKMEQSSAQDIATLSSMMNEAVASFNKSGQALVQAVSG